MSLKKQTSAEVYFWCTEKRKKGPIQISYHNFALSYVIALNFGRNMTSIALISNWYNLASMLQYNVFWKPFHIWCLLAESPRFWVSFPLHLNQIVSNDMVFSYEEKVIQYLRIKYKYVATRIVIQNMNGT